MNTTHPPLPKTATNSFLFCDVTSSCLAVLPRRLVGVGPICRFWEGCLGTGGGSNDETVVNLYLICWVVWWIAPVIRIIITTIIIVGEDMEVCLIFCHWRSEHVQPILYLR